MMRWVRWLGLVLVMSCGEALYAPVTMPASDTPIEIPPPEKPPPPAPPPDLSHGQGAPQPVPGDCGAMPRLPDPIPRPSSSRQVLPDRLGAPATLGAAEVALRSALNAAGFSDPAVYCYLDGFAVITTPERIDDQAVPFKEPDRWGVGPRDRRSLVAEILEWIFASPGHYRVLLFTVTRQPAAFTGPRPTPEQLNALATGGASRLSPELRALPFAGYEVSAAVYELEQVDTSRPVQLAVPGRYGVAAHLARAGLRTLAEP